ncbi:MAG: oxidoreductase, partial [Luteimonas sp.]
MTTKPTATTPQADDSDADLRARLRDATELLESVAADRSVLDLLPEEDRQRLRQAMDRVANPDRTERRQLRKAALRERNDMRNQRDDAVLDATGIRTLRRKP